MASRSQRVAGRRFTTNEQEGTFGGDGKALHHDHGGCYTIAYICQNLLKCTLQMATYVQIISQ